MLQRLIDWFKKLPSVSLETWWVSLFGASFLVGVWYAFPMVNTVSDVWAYGGGVLRAMEAGTLLPGGGELSYGTVSFYQNYLAMAVALLIGVVATGFDVEAVKTALILNPHYSLLVPRIVSALTAIGFLFLVYQFLRKQAPDVWWRTALLLLLFGNVLTIILTRSGKMWILSMALVTISFLCLYWCLTKERSRGMPGTYALVSVVAAALAAANFAFAALFFIAIPIIFLAFPKTWPVFRALLTRSLAGLAVFGAIVLLNAENIIEQVSGFIPSFFKSAAPVATTLTEHSLTLYESIRVKLRHVIDAFPLFLLAGLAVVTRGVKDRTLVLLSALYGAVYFCALVFVFRTDHDIALNVRHVFPLAIFFTFFLAGFHAPRKLFSGLLIVASGFLYIYTVWLLSVPATYNDAYHYVTATYGERDIRIEEHIFELALPMNQASYALFTENLCATTCQYRRSLSEDIAFRPIVITGESDPAQVGTLVPDIVITERAVPGCAPVARFGNPVPDDEVFDIDINLGRLLLPSFYQLHQLGKNLYVYETATCPQAGVTPTIP